LFRHRGFPIGDVVEETPDGRQTAVASNDLDLSFLLQMVQKSHNLLSGQVGQLKVGDSAMVLAGNKAKKLAPPVPIA